MLGIFCNSLDAELSLKVASWKTNNEGFPEHFDSVKSVIPKVYDSILILQLLFSLLKM
jgi:hypothetical protein